MIVPKPKETPERIEALDKARGKRRRRRGRAIEKFAKRVTTKWRGKTIADVRFADVPHSGGLRTITLVMADGSHLEVGTVYSTVGFEQFGKVRLIIDGRDTDLINEQ